MSLGVLDATAWAALAAWATIVVSIVIAIATWKKQTRAAMEAQEAQTRPFVVVDFDVFTQRTIILLTIANIGKTLARNVVLHFDPPLSSSMDDQYGTLSKLPLLTEGIPTLAPGKTIPILFDSFMQRGDDRNDAYTVRLSYDGDGDRHYEDDVLLDLGIYRNIMYVQRNDVHDLHAELKRITQFFKKWTSPYGGLKIRSKDDEGREREEHRAEFEEFRRTQAELADQVDGASPSDDG